VIAAMTRAARRRGERRGARRGRESGHARRPDCDDDVTTESADESFRFRSGKVVDVASCTCTRPQM
jgi:hypothetical protein